MLPNILYGKLVNVNFFQTAVSHDIFADNDYAINQSIQSDDEIDEFQMSNENGNDNFERQTDADNETVSSLITSPGPSRTDIPVSNLKITPAHKVKKTISNKESSLIEACQRMIDSFALEKRKEWILWHKFKISNKAKMKFMVRTMTSSNSVITLYHNCEHWKSFVILILY